LKQERLVQNRQTITIERAKKFLEDNGYSVTKEDSEEAPTMKGIISDFYKKLTKLYKKLKYLEVLAIRESSDYTALRKYIKKNEELGISRKDALKDLRIVLDLFFNNYLELKLTTPISNLRFLLSDGSWIFDKLRTIQRRKIEVFENSYEAEEWFNRLCESEDDIITELRERRHRELLSIGDKYAKEKEN
jgi:hypothetical protein